MVIQKPLYMKNFYDESLNDFEILEVFVPRNEYGENRILYEIENNNSLILVEHMTKDTIPKTDLMLHEDGNLLKRNFRRLRNEYLREYLVREHNEYIVSEIEL